VRELNAEVDPGIARILSKMIAKEPADRYQSCHELAEDLATHGQVSRGTITLQPKISTAAATVLGMKTPTPAAHAQTPAPMPTPARVATPAPAAAVHEGGGVHRSVLDRQGGANTRPGSNAALPLAIAAGLLLCLAGGAYAFRDRIPGLSGLFAKNDVVAGTGAETGLRPLETQAPATGRDTTATLPAQAGSVTATSGASAGDAAIANALAANAGSTVANGSGDGATPGTDTTLGTGEVQAANDGPAARTEQASDLDALRNLPASQAATEAVANGARIATAPKPPVQTAPPKPRVPTIAVAAGGDRVISGPARDAVTRLLRSHGFRVIEASGGGERPNLRSLGGRADAVMYIHARPVGSQELAYYGQTSTLYTVQLGVKAYKVSDGRVLWSSGTEQINFTSLNASEKAREAIEPMLDDVEANLAEFRPRGGRG
jgi:serine/threonine-protein kinase